MSNIYRRRRFAVAIFFTLFIMIAGVYSQIAVERQITKQNETANNTVQSGTSLALDTLETLEIKGRSPKTGYSREMFGNGWRKSGECDTRNDILARDMQNEVIENCKVYSGILDDPYTGKKINFTRGPDTSDDVQIDHVVALSDAWQKGAQLLGPEVREDLANDPLELLAVDGAANQQKSDGDAATWLPPNKAYRCRYIARQIAVKQKYSLWITKAEYYAMSRVLSTCPRQVLPVTQP